MDLRGDGEEWSTRRCGACANCQKPNCGRCNACRKMSQFTGKRQSGKLMCLEHPCQSESQEEIRIVGESEEVNCDDEGDQHRDVVLDEDDLLRVVEDPVLGRVLLYGSARICAGGKELVLRPGNFVLVRPDQKGVPLFVGQLMSLSMELDKHNEKVAHIRWMCRSIDTILGGHSEK